METTVHFGQLHQLLPSHERHDGLERIGRESGWSHLGEMVWLDGDGDGGIRSYFLQKRRDLITAVTEFIPCSLRAIVTTSERHEPRLDDLDALHQGSQLLDEHGTSRR